MIPSRVKTFLLTPGITCLLSLLLLLFPLSTQTSGFSLSLDLDGSEGDQSISSLDVFPNRTVSIQIFGTDIESASDISLRFEFDPNQVAYEGFKRATIVSGTSALTGKDFANIGITLSDGNAISGLIGTIHFRTTEAFSGTDIGLVRARLVRDGQTETVSLDLSVTLRVAKPPSPDIDGNGIVGIPDFLLFVDAFGSRTGQDTYEAKYDLNVDGEIGISDFLLFVDSFGKTVEQDNDDLPPHVTISAGTTPVTEGMSATFTITANPAPVSALTVNVDVSETGDVISGTASSSVTIDATATTATLIVNTVNDQADESNSVITAEVETGTGYTVGSSSSASVTVNDNDDPASPPTPPSPTPPSPPTPPTPPAPPTPPTPPPTPHVTISVGTTPVTEGTSVTFTITADPAPATALTVSIDVSETGDVISGTPASTVTIGATNTTATLTVNTVNDQANESNSVVTARVESGTGYTVGSSSSASVTVNDNDDPAPPPTPPAPIPPTPHVTVLKITISAGTTPVTEGMSATFAITASFAPTFDLTVNVDVSETGDVISGTPASTVTIGATNTTATLTVNTVNDQADESNSVITAEVETGTGYTVGSSSSASVTVNDNDDPASPSPDLKFVVFVVTYNPSADLSLPFAFNLTATVENGGNGPSAATTLRYYRSTDATYSTDDTEVGTDDVDGLAASGTSREGIDLTTQPSDGTYYIACIDAVAGESNTDNNCLSIQVGTAPSN